MQSRLYLDMEKIEPCHWLEDIIQPLFIRLEQEQLSPEAFRGRGIIGLIVGEDIEQMQIELHNLWLEAVRPKLLRQRGVHHVVSA